VSEEHVLETSHTALDADAVASVVDQLQREGVQAVRVTYCDLQGIARGKEVPLSMLGNATEHGLAFCVANLTDGLAGNPTDAPGMAPRRGYPDMRVRPLLTTIIRPPWEPQIAWCIGHVEEPKGFQGLAPRNVLQKVIGLYQALDLSPTIGPELEFFLLQTNHMGGFTRYIDKPSMAYVVGRKADPQGVVSEMLHAAQRMGLRVTAANHEFARSQFEINMLHGEALEAADRTFRFKSLVKELAARQGLLGTFLGKPFNDDSGSGFHIHISLTDRRDENAFAGEKPESPRPGQRRKNTPAAEEGAVPLSAIARHFLAGVLVHAPALMAFFAPTVNAYKRFTPSSLAPTAD